MLDRAHILVVLQFALFAVIAGAALLLPAQSPPALRLLMPPLMLLGAAVLGLALYQHLETNAGTPKVMPTPRAGTQLVTNGIYRYVRHPIYSAVLLVGLSVVVFHGHMVTILALVLLYGVFSVKARYEEGLLRAQHPDYDTYMQHTGRFLPRLRR